MNAYLPIPAGATTGLCAAIIAAHYGAGKQLTALVAIGVGIVVLVGLTASDRVAVTGGI